MSAGSSGAAGPGADTIPGIGIVGWLRAIYDKIKALIAALAGLLQVNINVGNNPVSGANPVPITGTVSATGATLNIVVGLSATARELNGAAYTGTSAIGGPYKLNCIKFHFSSALPRTITVTDVTTGALLAAPISTTSIDYVLPVAGLGFPDTHQFRVDVSATAGSCVMTFSAEIENGQLPFATSGSSPINPIFVAGGFIKDVNNSWASPVTLPTAGQVLTGTATDITGFSALTYNLFVSPDQMATPPALTFEFSTDGGANWDTQVQANINDGNIVIPVPLRPAAASFRLVYVHGTTNATAFRLTTYLHRMTPDQLIRTLAQTPQANDPATFTRAFIEPSFQGQELLIGADRAMDGSANVLPFIAQDKWQFDSPFANNNIIIVQAAGASATQSASTGAKLQTANAAGASSAQLLGQKKNKYSPTYEVRQIGSMVFPAAGLANARAMTGLTDQVTPGAVAQINPTLGNGLFVGYIGATFGFHIVTGGAVTTIARANWNGDPSLSGAATAANGLLGLSAFRKNNKPLEWDLTQGWAFRIRYKYFGVAFVRLEVESPDGIWVIAHTQRGPFGSVPNIQNPSLFLFQESTKLIGAGVGTLVTQSFSNCCGVVAPEIFFERYEINGHLQVQKSFANLAATLSPAYTVSPGRQLLISSLQISVAAGGGAGQLVQLFDGATLVYTFQSSTNNTYSNSSDSFSTPLLFSTAVNIVISGTLSCSVNFSGYEKEI